MPIRFRCPQCDQLLSIGTRRAGADVPCPACGQVLRVPEPDAAAASVPRIESPAEDPPFPPEEFLSPPGPEVSAPPAQPAGDVEFASAPDAAETIADESDPPLRFRRKPVNSGDLDMTPMVDMTFLLLIFFMVTASFSQQKTLPLPAPDPDKQGASHSQQMLEEILDASAEIDIDGQNGVFLDDEPVNDLETLPDALRATGKTEAILKIDRRALHETVVKVVDACNAAGMQKIRIAGRSGDAT